MTRRRTNHALTAALLAVALAAACGGPGERHADLVEIPAPDLATAEETVKRQIEEAELEVERRSQGGAEAAEIAAAYGDLGLVYVTYSFLDAAEAAFENARRLALEDYRWPYLLGYLFQIQGRLEEAEEALGRVLELAADDVPALIRLGTVQLELGADDEAEALFRRVVELEPASAAGHNGLGRAAAALGRHGDAVEHFERALELQPQASSIRYALGLSYRALGERERARLNLEQGGDAQALFADPLLQPVAELGRSAELFLVRGAQAFSERRFAQAAEFYRRALELEPGDLTTHKALGFCLEKLGDLDGAIAELELALRVGTTGDPDKDRLERSELYRIMGGLLVLQGRDPDAIAAFEQTLELDPDRLDAHIKLANALARARRFDAALPHYDRVLEELPDHAEVRAKRAAVLVNLDRGREALAEFERAVTAAPQDAMIRLRFAEALEFLGRADRATEERRRARELATDGPDRAALLLTEARSLVPQGRLEEALDTLEEALAADPGSADARYELARLLGHFGRYDQAQREFERVVEQVPWHRPARHGEVTALLLLERYGEAAERLRGGLEAMPLDRALTHALARLLAIAPGRRGGDGRQAVELATRVHAAGATIDTATTLALALAAAGDFEQAAALQRRIVGESRGRVDGSRLALLEARLAAFERLEPWQARSPGEILPALVAPLPPAGGS